MLLRRLSKVANAIYLRKSFINRFLSNSGVSNLELEAFAGNIDSMAKLGIKLVETEQHDKGLSWLEKAAESDHGEAQFHLATTLQKMFTERQKGNNNNNNNKPGKAQTAQQVLNEIRKEQADARVKKKKKNNDKKKKDKINEQGPEGETEGEGGVYKNQWKNMPEEMLVEYWLRRAIKNGHGKAMISLGNYLISKSYTTNHEKCLGIRGALKMFRRAMKDQNEPDAAYNLGLLYYEGRDDIIEQDLEKSLNFFKNASSLGDVASSLWVGYCYAVGIGTTIHPQKALQFLNLAADKGHPDAYYYIATLYRSGAASPNGKSVLKADATTFMKYLRMAVDLDCGDAMYCLADLYWTGNDTLGITKNPAEAMYFYRKAENLGHAEATLCLGAIYYNGSSIAKEDKRKAFDLYNKAAVNGSLAAWRNLAQMYVRGDGVPQNKATAKHILKTMFNEDINGNQLIAASDSDASSSSTGAVSSSTSISQDKKEKESKQKESQRQANNKKKANQRKNDSVKQSGNTSGSSDTTHNTSVQSPDKKQKESKQKESQRQANNKKKANQRKNDSVKQSGNTSGSSDTTHNTSVKTTTDSEV